MKSACCVLILAIGLSRSDPDGTCPPVNNPNSNLLAHTSDCAKFYKCNWGEPILYSCPGGLHFNPRIGTCDWSENVKCVQKGNDNESGGNGTDGCAKSCVSSNCPAVNGHTVQYLMHSDCTKFCMCDWGKVVEFDCPTGLHFNPALDVCDWPENAGCTGNGGNSGKDDNEVDGQCSSGCDSSKCPETNGDSVDFVAHTDCGKYCMCNFGVAIEFSCPEGFHFNYDLKVCDIPEEAGCETNGGDGSNGGSVGEDDSEVENGGTGNDGDDEDDGGNGSNGGTIRLRLTKREYTGNVINGGNVSNDVNGGTIRLRLTRRRL